MLEKRKRIKRRSFPLLSFRKLSPSSLVFLLIGFALGVSFYPVSDNIPWLASSHEKAHIRACFSPHGNCTDKVIAVVNSAKSSILVSAYSFTCPLIAKALTEAYERGVDVKVLIDKSQLKEKYSQIRLLSHKEIPIFIDPAAGATIKQ